MKRLYLYLASLSLVLTVLIVLVSSAKMVSYVYFGGPDYFWRISKEILDKKRLHRLDVNTNEKKLIYETKEDLLIDISVAPTDTLIALLVKKEGVTPPDTFDYIVLPKNSLVFISPDGNEIGRLDEDVRKFSWSPDGQKIAYITGTYYEGGVGFKTTGVGIFDLKDRSKKQIKKDFPHRTIEGFKGGGYEIKWAKHDNNIYIRDFDYLDGIYRYNTKTGKSEKVDCNGIDFSPDGKYYIGDGTLYLTSTNENIMSLLRQKFGQQWTQFSLEWVFDKGHCLHFIAQKPIQKADGKWDYEGQYNVIYDVEKDEILKEVTLPISWWKGSPNKLVFEKDGKIIVETYEDLFKK